MKITLLDETMFLRNWQGKNLTNDLNFNLWGNIGRDQGPGLEITSFFRPIIV